jgi:hypothetical protein
MNKKRLMPDAGRRIPASSALSPRCVLRLASCVLIGAIFLLVLPRVNAQTPGEARFFADCPHGPHRRVHDERNLWDLHAAVYTVLGVSELEVLRTADWLVDLAVPGRIRPFQGAVRAVRAGFHRLPRWRLVQRAGELADAVQLAELSFGDATATYSVATGGTTGPGSGLVIRAHKLIDWTQHVVQDVNAAAGTVVGRPQGLIRWHWPGYAVDGAQWLLLKTFTHASVVVARVVDDGLTAVELVAEAFVNLGRRRPHEETTAFLRLPRDVYRSHELWMLEHRPQLVLGTAAEFRRATHAALAHRRRALAVADWSQPDRLLSEPELIVMTSARVLSRAPASLQPYVVPAAWVLNDPERH